MKQICHVKALIFIHCVQVVLLWKIKSLLIPEILICVLPYVIAGALPEDHREAWIFGITVGAIYHTEWGLPDQDTLGCFRI